MTKIIIPPKLKPGDEIRVIAPARSLALISEANRQIANDNLAKLGLKVSFGQHVLEQDESMSSSLESRLQDLHEAFLDKNVKAIITVIGGFNSNQLLQHIDWKIIKNNPKIFCGYSDITVLHNAILAKANLATYYGPHYSTLSQKLHLDYTLEYFKKCLFSAEPISIKPCSNWTDDLWYFDQDKREPIKNEGWLLINEGEATGTIFGGNSNTLGLLKGTEYFPKIKNSILFLEDDNLVGPMMAVEFDRTLQAFIHLPEFKFVKGIVIGRFQKASQMTTEKIKKIVKGKKELNNLPVIANVEFSHIEPRLTVPIGGEAYLSAKEGEIKLEFIKH